MGAFKLITENLPSCSGLTLSICTSSQPDLAYMEAAVKHSVSSSLASPLSPD